jgi:hypothetical protein
MNAENLPPWLSLPEEVRRRVVERMNKVQKPCSRPSNEQLRIELQELGMFRLIRHFKGDVNAAIKYCHQERTSFEPWDPQRSSDSAEWLAAANRTMKRLEARMTNEAELAYSEILMRTVREELDRYTQANN